MTKGYASAGRTILSVIGTRPEAIKMKQVLHALANRRVPQRVALTGQHASLRALIEEFSAFELDLALRDLGVEELTERIRAELVRHLAGDPPALVLVQGDTSSALAGALAAGQAGIPVGHV